MGKMKYSEVKHEDKFHEILSSVWGKLEPYTLSAGLAAIALLAIAAVWMVVARHHTATGEKPWIERFEIGERIGRSDKLDDEEKAKELLGELTALARTYQGQPAAAITLLEVAQSHLALGRRHDGTASKDSREHLEKAAQAAEQFVADFPDHPLVALAHYEAGKARLDLAQYEGAADHFEQARKSPIAFLAALARLHEGRCYEKLGRLDKARQAYEAVRDDKMAAWCADQAEFHLTRLRRTPQKGS